MRRTHYSAAARADLREIAAYIAEDSPAAAGRVVVALERACRSLATHPGIGRRRPELAPDLRSFAVGNYILFYRVRGDVVEIAAVLHGARDVERLLRDDVEP